MLIMGVFLVYSWFSAYYTVDGNILKYRLGINRGKIQISSIKSIAHTKFPLAGNRPALDWNGLLISYSGRKTIFISPEEPEKLIGLLKKQNDNIQITE